MSTSTRLRDRLVQVTVFVGFLMTMVVAAVTAQDMATPATSTAEAVKQLGSAGLVVCTLAWMLRYFMGLYEKKEDRVNQLTDRLISVLEQTNVVVGKFGDEMRERRGTDQALAMSVREMTAVLADLRGATFRKGPREGRE